MAHAFGFPIRSAGKSIIATEQSRTNTAYGYLATEDKVPGIVLPTDGLIFVSFWAVWKESVTGAARAAIHLGSNPIVLAEAGDDPFANEAQIGGTADRYVPLVSDPARGLVSTTGGAGTDPSETGQLVAFMAGSSFFGGTAAVFADAGTYEVGIKTKSSSGSVTMKDRRLRVWSVAFDS